MALPLALAATGSALAYDVNDQLAINGLLAGAGQCQEITGGAPLPTLCRGAVVFQPEVSYTPTRQDQFYAKLDFAGWNGLNLISPFVLVPWAASLEADVRHINGSNRNYLLEAWYAHTFAFAADNTLQITGGIIDPTRYVDGNAFANDEYTQFMSEVLVNPHNGFIPAYDWGGAAVWKFGHWTSNGVGINVTKNSDGYNYNWFAGEVGDNLTSGLGEGNYRLMYAGTSSAFLSPVPATDPNADPTTNLDQPQPGLRAVAGF